MGDRPYAARRQVGGKTASEFDFRAIAIGATKRKGGAPHHRCDQDRAAIQRIKKSQATSRQNHPPPRSRLSNLVRRSRPQFSGRFAILPAEEILITLVMLVPAEGIEPPTNGLQNRCSTAELSRQFQIGAVLE
jgi:hypothetical protein